MRIIAAVILGCSADMVSAATSRCGILFRLLCVLGALYANGAKADPSEGTIVFGGDQRFPPYEWMQDGDPVGFHVEIAQALAAAGNVKAEYRLAPWGETIDALKSGRVDIVPMFRTEEREKHFWFSSPIYFAPHGLFTATDPGRAKSPQETAAWRVAVVRSTMAHENYVAAGADSNLVLVATSREALEHVAAGKADYAALTAAPANYLIKSLDLPLRRVGPPLWPNQYAFAVHKDREDTISWLDGNFNKIVYDGTFQRIADDWKDRVDPYSVQTNDNGWASLLLLLLLLILAAGYAYQRHRHRKEVRMEREKRSEAERAAEFLARHDAFSRLPNRESFIHSISQVVETAVEPWPVQILAGKVLNVEEVAKTHGRAAAEEMLRQITIRLQSVGKLAGSLSRSSFAIAISLGDSRRLLELLAEPFLFQTIQLAPITVWGAAQAPADSSNPGELLDKAEIALAACAPRRRIWLHYTPSLEPQKRELELVKDFELFGKEDIFPVYQPQMDLRSGRITAAEALVRWRHPKHGFIPPSDFIPLLEEAGLVSIVTKSMIDKVARQSAELRADGLNCRLSVNISMHDLTELDVVDSLERAFKRHGALPRDIIVELTETAALKDPDLICTVLNNMKDLGVGVAIDDFGTGFSSLASLSALSFDELKIDRMFISKFTVHQTYRSIVSSTLRLAHDLGLTVVAEGAEDETTLHELRNSGCERAQGYAVSKSLFADELAGFVRAYAWRPCPVFLPNQKEAG